MNSILNHFNENLDNDDIELEVSYNIRKSDDIYKFIFNKLKDATSDINIIENIDIYYVNNVRQTKTFIKGVNQNKDIMIKKESILQPYIFRESIDNVINHKLKISLEKKIKSNKDSIKFIRIKLRVRFDINDKYMIDLDLIKNIDTKEKHLVEIKNMLFKDYNISNMIENIKYSLFDNILLEVEFKKVNISNSDINESVNFVKSLLATNVSRYQKYIFKIATFIINNRTYLENFKSKSGLKKLLNNVKEMTADTYYKDLVPNIENYYMTDKIDGLRCICFIEEYEDGVLNIKLINNKLYYIKEYNAPSKTSNRKVTILDCELMYSKDTKDEIISKNDIYLYIFDIIAFENNKIGTKPFEDRIEVLVDGFNKIKSNINSRVKEYVKLTSNYREEIKSFYERKNNDKNYSIDGLIFVPTSKVKNEESKFQINTNYNNMIGYKWKPVEHMTIDFFVCELPKNMYGHIPYNSLKLKDDEIIYILFSGITIHDYNRLNLNFMTDYKRIVPEKFQKGDMIPIQFTTSDNPHNYVFVSFNKELNGRVCEFGYKDNKWDFKKIRTDRDVELERGEYFGNYYKISEMIWGNINNPLTLEMLTSEANNSYFLKDDNILYKAQRSYNSFVKSYILETITSDKLTDKNDKDFVIDLAAGKGQDLNRLSNLKFKKGLFIDYDKNALSELINRRQGRKFKGDIKIFTKNIDLTIDHKEIIKELSVFDIKKDSVDVIICNFAIHYIISNEDALINIIKLLTHYLKPNGRFAFTCFDGNRIFNLLKTADSWNKYEGDNLKYSIKKLYKTDIMSKYGQKIDVLLPFSDNEYYTENLIDIDNLINMFNGNGFTTEISLPFDLLLDEFKTNNKRTYDMLTAADKEFISLYQFVIIKKNQSESIISKSNISTFFNNHTVEGNLEDKREVGNLHLIENVNNSNQILILVNTNIQTILDNIIKMYEGNGYKNWDNNKRSRNKIVRVVGFDHDDYLKEYKNACKKKSYETVVLYDKSFKYIDYYNNIMTKKFTTPIILTDDNNYRIIILDTSIIKDITDIYQYIDDDELMTIHN